MGGRILVAEDEASIRELIAINLRRSGFEVIEACDGQRAVELYNEHEGRLDIMLLDIMMPVLDGVEVCRRIREVNRGIGIIFLTAKTQESDKVTGLLSGADDYVTKPFSISELMARVNSVYRRVELNNHLMALGESRDCIELGEFRLDLKKHVLMKNGEPIELTQIEYQIIECFFNSPDTPMNREEILSKVWGGTYYGEEKVVDVNIRRLRVKVETQPSQPRHLMTVWGRGYQWKT